MIVKAEAFQLEETAGAKTLGLEYTFGIQEIARPVWLG